MTETVLQTVSLLASIASLILAVLAIWLSIKFFQMSSNLSEKANDAAKGVAASVDRLESVFDKLYADTFSMMRETVTDMRKHIWPEGPSGETDIAKAAEQLAEKKLEDVRERIGAELDQMLKRQRITDDKLESLQAETRELIGRAVEESRRAEVEARDETLRDSILQVIRSRGGFAEADDIVGQLAIAVPLRRVLAELRDMRKDHRLEWHGHARHIDRHTIIHLAGVMGPSDPEDDA